MRDHLALHLATDSSINWHEIQIPSYNEEINPSFDWHHKFIDEFDRTRDFQRGDLMCKALEITRSLVKNKLELNWTELKRIQSVVLGTETISFRSEPAKAKEGLEIYGYNERLPGVFKTRQTSFQRETVSPIVRAVRAYLDICFFHPFFDGNSRAARLVFDFILSSASIRLRDARPIFAFERFAGNHEQYEDLVRLVGKLAFKGK